MNRLLLFLLGLLIADLAVATGTNDPSNVVPVKTNCIELLQSSNIVIKGLWKGRSTTAGSNRVDRTLGLGDRTETSVMQGLRWLVSSQNNAGSWGDKTGELEASTGVALLAFFARGETSTSAEFGKSVEAGLKYLVSIQQAANRTDRTDQVKAISHAISTWAICQGYGLTRIPHLKTPADGGLAVILKGQRPSGLWEGAYQMDGGRDDMEASIWQVMALHNGKMAGSQLDGLQECLDKAVAGMEKALEANPDSGTKAGLVFCMQLCGQGHKPVVRTAVADLSNLTPAWDAPAFGDPLFRWFLTTEAIFQNGGKPWMNWNRQFNPILVNHQVKQDGSGGKTVGYWDSPGKKERFGRVYSTALSLLMLEIYYAWLPSYDSVPDSTNDFVIKIEGSTSPSPRPTLDGNAVGR